MQGEALTQHISDQTADAKIHADEHIKLHKSQKKIEKDLAPILEERRDLAGAVRLGSTASKVVAIVGGAIITLYSAYLVIRAVLFGGPAPQ